ncbi:uncharacterized protein METZ01_LOCUS302832, partial [marine metagenome]
VYNKARGILTFQISLDLPASKTATLLFLSSDSLFARTHPADPAPIII